jgi:hypothetical protein
MLELHPPSPPLQPLLLLLLPYLPLLLPPQLLLPGLRLPLTD